LSALIIHAAYYTTYLNLKNNLNIWSILDFVRLMIYLTNNYLENAPRKKQTSTEWKEGDRTFIHDAEYKKNYFSSLPMQLPKYYIPRVGEKSRHSCQKPRTNYSQIAWMSAPGRRSTRKSYC